MLNSRVTLSTGAELVVHHSSVSIDYYPFTLPVNESNVFLAENASFTILHGAFQCSHCHLWIGRNSVLYSWFSRSTPSPTFLIGDGLTVNIWNVEYYWSQCVVFNSVDIKQADFSAYNESIACTRDVGFDEALAKVTFNGIKNATRYRNLFF